ncbi:MAG: hypothetical protein MMC33_007162 [Icmadophila ericetorum]|nr:hypothetical protein [Icmadophila ericetorum]
MPSKYSHGFVIANQRDPQGLGSASVSRCISLSSTSSATRLSSPIKETGREKIVIDENGSKVVAREGWRATSLGTRRNKARIIIREDGSSTAEKNRPASVDVGGIEVRPTRLVLQETISQADGYTGQAIEAHYDSRSSTPGSVARARAGLVVYEPEKSSEMIQIPTKIERRDFASAAPKRNFGLSTRSERLVLDNPLSETRPQTSENISRLDASQPPASHPPGDLRSLGFLSIGAKSLGSTQIQPRLKPDTTQDLPRGFSSSVFHRQSSISSQHSTSDSISSLSVVSSTTGPASSVVTEIYDPIPEHETFRSNTRRVEPQRSQSLTSALKPTPLKPRNRPVSMVPNSNRQMYPASTHTRQSPRRSESTMRGSRPSTAKGSSETPRPILRTAEKRSEDDEAYYGGSEEDTKSVSSLSSLSSFSFTLKPWDDPDQNPDLPADFHHITRFPTSRPSSSRATSPSLVRGYSTDDAIPPPISRCRPSNPVLHAQISPPKASPPLPVLTVPVAHPYLPPQVHPPQAHANSSHKCHSSSNHRLPFHIPSLNIFHYKHSKGSPQQPRPVTALEYVATPPLRSTPPSIPYTSPFRPSPEPSLEDPPPRSNSLGTYSWQAPSTWDILGMSKAERERLQRRGVNPRLLKEMQAARKGRVMGGGLLVGNVYIG